jgi:hypothetical protein
VALDRLIATKHGIDDFSLVRIKLSGLPELMDLLSLDFEQAGFHGCGALQAPQEVR